MFFIKNSFIFSSSTNEFSINLDAFQILFAKFDACSSFSSINLISFPIVVPDITENLNASAPYFSITSIGSIPLPSVFDIFLPWLSLTNPCITTSLNGGTSVNSKPCVIILDTQKVIISKPVTNTFVG